MIRDYGNNNRIRRTNTFTPAQTYINLNHLEKNRFWSNAETHMWFDWLWIGFHVADATNFVRCVAFVRLFFSSFFSFSINAEQVPVVRCEYYVCRNFVSYDNLWACNWSIVNCVLDSSTVDICPFGRLSQIIIIIFSHFFFLPSSFNWRSNIICYARFAIQEKKNCLITIIRRIFFCVSDVRCVICSPVNINKQINKYLPEQQPK